MTQYPITLIPGDGIGPEVVTATVRVLEATGISFDWQTVALNSSVMTQSRLTVPQKVIESITKNKIAIKGPISTPVGSGYVSPNMLLRQQLGLFASVRPAQSIPGIASAVQNLDVIVVRENTEDLYSGIENEVEPGKVVAHKVITRRASERVARCAFELAVSQNRKKVTALHKADIMKLSDGLFLESCRNIAKEFKDTTYNEVLIDSACTLLVVDPSQFDVIVTENMYGDIVSDLTSGLIGGLGLAGSVNIGADIKLYEAVHGSAPDIAGKAVANPTGLLMASVMMLRSLGETNAAAAIKTAVTGILAENKNVTPDLGGNATTDQFIEAVIKRMGQQ
ncbi:MAG TPA: isocitrate/isopropylmalate dehydrogenase family protein [Candidatus Saccharimonadales bacterium]|nr:isocitrate/isopropylmalate dehydrogenase family protein [Candidatus Saccharimonadales bacterium]